MSNNADRLLLYAKGKNKIACYGAGQFGKEVFAYLHDFGIDICLFAVSIKPKDTNDYFGIQLLQISEVKNPKSYTWIITVSSLYRNEVANVLKQHGIRDFFCVDEEVLSDIRQTTMDRNISLKNIDHRERCFILGTGPSLKKQDLTLLRKEDVFSTSWCNLFQNYTIINPKYYVTPPAFGDMKGEDYIYEINKYLNKTIISKYMILDYFDKPYISKMNLFRDKYVFYLIQNRRWKENRNKIFDICKPSPYVQTATIMLLKVAMYIGYKKIYLLGTEHDLVSKKYDHAYSLDKLLTEGEGKLYKMLTTANDAVEHYSCREILTCQLNMYNEYYYLHKIAVRNGVEIFNATAGGDLDEFPRVSYNNLF